MRVYVGKRIAFKANSAILQHKHVQIHHLLIVVIKMAHYQLQLESVDAQLEQVVQKDSIVFHK